MRHPVPLTVPLGAFAVTAGVLAYLHLVIARIPLWIGVAIGVLSVVAFALYAVDKSAARRGARRIPESALLVIGLVGGWPGAAIAQQVLRHKTHKASFQAAFWVTVALDVVALVMGVASGTADAVARMLPVL